MNPKKGTNKNSNQPSITSSFQQYNSGNIGSHLSSLKAAPHAYNSSSLLGLAWARLCFLNMHYWTTYRRVLIKPKIVVWLVCRLRVNKNPFSTGLLCFFGGIWCDSVYIGVLSSTSAYHRSLPSTKPQSS